LASRSRERSGTHREKIFVVDDHPVLREGLSEIINRQRDLVVCGAAETAAGAITGVASLKPRLAIVDLSLKGGKSGEKLIGELRSRYPWLAVLVLSMHDESLYAERVLKAGARGYVMKEEAPEKLVTAIRRVLAGDIFLSDRMRSRYQRTGTGGGPSGT
jgi:DNA-binding NarL/FixJ family response regulator